MFITNEPALKVGKFLVVTDLHIGVEYEYWRRGFFIPSQVDELIERADALLKRTRARTLVINGDFKHNIPSMKFQEIKDLKKFVDGVNAEVKIIMGNHDGGIRRVFDDVSNDLTVGSVYICHGHMKPKLTDKIKTIVIGHNHPMIALNDIAGRVYKKVWVIGEYEKRKTIIMPAFNPIIGGKNVLESGLMGPIARHMKNKKVYLLDGTYLGPMDELKSP